MTATAGSTETYLAAAAEAEHAYQVALAEQVAGPRSGGSPDFPFRNVENRLGRL